MAIWQTELDICYMYRHAIKPAEQIKIMAELNGCSIEKIKDILRKHGLNIAEAPKAKRRRVRTPKWTVEDLIKFLYLDAIIYRKSFF